MEERHRDNSRGRDSRLRRSSLHRDNSCMENITFGACFARIKSFYPSVMVNQLMGLGIVPLATELARCSLPLAGRL